MSTGTDQSSIIALMQFDFEQPGDQLNDLTGHGIVGTLSDCTLVDDPDMSLCQQFNGTSSYIPCSPTVFEADTSQSSVFKNGITITTWVKFDLFPSTGYSYLLQLVRGGSGISFYTSGDQLCYWTNNKSCTCDETLVTGRWYHLAIAVDNNGNAQFFVNGQPSTKTTDSALAPPNMNGNGKQQEIGGWDGGSYLNGTMAWMAVYNGACQQPMIEADLAQGESKRFTSFRQSFPVGFKLNSDDGGAESPILFIESQGEGKDLHLRVHNTGSTPINFYTPSPAVTKASEITDENYHVQLRFRPGILAENYIAENPITSLLKLSSETATNWLGILKKDTSGTYSMNFLYIGSAPLVIPAQGEALIVIKEVNASASQGSRNTNVEFRYQNVLPGKTPVLTGASQTVPLEGHRVQNLSIVNHAGVKDIALRAEIVGPANVMTYSGAADGTPPESSLQFQLVNTGSNDLELGLPSSADGATEFTLTIDVQPADYTAEWALIDHGVGNKLTLALGDGVNGWTPDSNGSVPTGNPNQLQWTIANQSVNSFAQGEGLTFTLSGIECSLPVGSSIVTIGYKNIPGHWQGAFELSVTKSPVTYSRNGIGINTQEPKANLQIIEKDNITPIEVLHPGTALSELPAPTPLPNHTVYGRLISMENASQNYFDRTVIKGNLTSDPVYIRIWTINGLGASQQSFNKVEVPGLSEKYTVQGFGGMSENYGYSAPYIYVSWSISGVNKVSLFTYDASTQTATFVSDCDLGSGAQHQRMIYHQRYAFCPYANLSNASVAIRTYDITQNPAQKVQSLSLPSEVVNGRSAQINLLTVYRDYLYYMLESNLYACGIGADGALGSPNLVYDFKSNSETFLEPLVFNGNLLYCSTQGLNGFNILAVDISDLASCSNKVFLQLGKTVGVLDLAIREYHLLILLDDKIDIYDLSEPNSGTLVKSLPTARNTSYRGIAGDYLWTHHNPSTTTNLYDIKSVLNTLLGHGSYISSKSLSIGTPGLPDNSNLFNIYQDGEAQVIVTNDGWMGIGTKTPKAPLHVAGSTSMQVSDFGFLNNSNSAPDKSGSGCAGYFAGTLAKQVAIYTDQYIVALQFNAVSDLRVKDVLSLSDQGSDLSTLLSLQVSDYQYIDFVGKGAGQKKGLIAQQVKEVFPHAVSAENTDFIPDIYAMATDLQWQQATHHLQVKLENAHDLTVGDTVRVLAEEGFVEKDVVAVPDEKSFVISEWEKPVEKLFVFGKEVHDFHTVDYDQVAMLGVSAIQALHAEVESLKKENEALKTQMQSEMAELKAEWAAFKTSVAQQYQN